jgi:hypothetical protein
MVLVRIVPTANGGAEVRLSIYTPGFPYRTIDDPPAMAFLDTWLAEIADELQAQTE